MSGRALDERRERRCEHRRFDRFGQIRLKPDMQRPLPAVSVDMGTSRGSR
jgi:hypothetical protein